MINIEYDFVYELFKQLEVLGFNVMYVLVDFSGFVLFVVIELVIMDEIILVFVMYVNNEIGIIQLIEEIGQMLMNYFKVFFYVDYVQGIGKVLFFLVDYKIDLCILLGYKIYGLKGMGILYK